MKIKAWFRTWRANRVKARLLSLETQLKDWSYHVENRITRLNERICTISIPEDVERRLTILERRDHALGLQVEALLRGIQALVSSDAIRKKRGRKPKRVTE